MFDKFEKFINSFINRIKKIKILLVIFRKVIFWLLLAAIFIGIIVSIDFIGNEVLDFGFMKPLYSFVMSLLFETDWTLLYGWVMNLFLNIILVVVWTTLIIAIIVIFLEYKEKIVFLSNPTKIRFLKLVRNFLIFFVFFLAVYELSIGDDSMKGMSALYGFFALIVTLVEDWIHKKRAPYIETLENEATRVVKLSEYFEIDSTYHYDFENTDVRAKVVSKVTGSNKEYAIEYFTNYPTKSKILLAPIMELDIMKIKYFCKILNNMKLEFEPAKFKEFKVRIFNNSELYKFVNYINYDFLSGIVRNRFFLQDVYYDIKHYYELDHRD